MMLQRYAILVIPPNFSKIFYILRHEMVLRLYSVANPLFRRNKWMNNKREFGGGELKTPYLCSRNQERKE